MSDTFTRDVKFVSDEKGYYDRQCPSEKCQFVFKILMEDWKTKVSDEQVHCPLCGYVAPANKWYTDEHIKEMNAHIENIANQAICDIFAKNFGAYPKTTHKGCLTIKYTPPKCEALIDTPIPQREAWKQDITCEKCGTRFSVIGNAYFCPCCGYNTIEKELPCSLNSIENKIHVRKNFFEQFSNSCGEDDAERLCQSILENSIGDIVSVFQKYSADLYNSHTKPVLVNNFQQVDNGSDLFRKILGHGYESWLSPDELRTMKIMFQRRHILEHNKGYVDSKYLQKCDDTAYKEGQRIVVKENDVLEFLRIIRKLVDGLASLRTPI